MFEEYAKSSGESKTALAKKFSISRVCLYDWINAGVPFERIASVAKITKISVTGLILETYSKRYGTEGLIK